MNVYLGVLLIDICKVTRLSSSGIVGEVEEVVRIFAIIVELSKYPIDSVAMVLVLY